MRRSDGTDTHGVSTQPFYDSKLRAFVKSHDYRKRFSARRSYGFCLCNNEGRGGSGNSDSVIRGSLASPKPPEGGEPEEHGNEENETQSRGTVQRSGGIGRGQRRQDPGRISRALSRPSHPDHRVEAAIAGAGSGHIWRIQTTGGDAGSQNPPRQDRTTGPGE
jgi:hypothetical protein